MDFALLLPFHLLVLAVFTNRYVVGLLFRFGGGGRPAREDYEPTVTVVVPMFNEGKGIYATVQSLLAQDYPADKLRIIVVDDCSHDDSLAWAQKAARERPDRVVAIENPFNMGKRRGINHAVRHATTELIVSVDSDVIVDRRAVRMLVRRFTDPSIVAVGGRVNISNPHENWLTRMQTIKYYFGYEFLKSLERAFTTVMCLSGCLTAYRRSVLIELEPILENRNVLGVPIKYGEDRFLTRQIVKAGYRTTVTLDAVCWTVAPNKPGNVFRTTSGEVRLLDFGIARLTDAASANATVTGATMGTPAYMPPEQARGVMREVDARSDVWAAGATLFSMITGAKVRDGESNNEMLVMAVTQPVRPICERAPWVSPALAAIVDKAALAFDKAARFQSAAEMTAALASLPPEALRDPATEATLALQPNTYVPPTVAARAPAFTMMSSSTSVPPASALPSAQSKSLRLRRRWRSSQVVQLRSSRWP